MKNLMEEALAIYEEKLGAGSIQVAQAQTSLAVAYERLSDDDESRRCQRELLEGALATKERLLGREHVDIVWNLTHLARLHGADRDFVETRTLLERALVLVERHHGRWNLQAAHVSFSLAVALDELGEKAQAVAVMEGAREIFRQQMPPGAAEVREVEEWIAARSSWGYRARSFAAWLGEEWTAVLEGVQELAPELRPANVSRPLVSVDTS